MESDGGHDPRLWEGLAELGVPGLQVPAAHGGSGLELLEVALAAEELGWCCTPGPFLACALATAALLASGNAEAAARWLPAIARGRAIVTLALGEEGDEWDAARLTTRAQGGTLSGRKPLVPYAAVADAILVAAGDAEGRGFWLVEGGGRGLGVTPLRGTDMPRRVAAVELEAAPATKIAAGRAAIDRARDAGLVLLAADAYGGARRCLDMTVKYALTREQFGQPIGAFQAVKHQLADLAADLDPALSLWWYAAHAYDHIPERAARPAARASCVTSTTVEPRARLASRMRASICSPVRVSRLPVGSSARIRAGSITSARAIATRCISPPESSSGRWRRRCPSPTRSSAACTRSRTSRGRRRSRRSGSATFSSAE